MSNSLPHAQRLLEKHRRDERVRVVAVATAFEKDHYPWMADEERIRQRLEREGWEFPVMRDRDEHTVRIVGLGSSYGTPMTLVVDKDGVVRWHGFNSSEETAAEVDATVEELLRSFYAPAIEGLPRALRSYAEQDYGKAWVAAEKILGDERADAGEKQKAREVQDNIRAAVQRFVSKSDASLLSGHPSDALAALDEAAAVFKGSEPGDEARARYQELKRDTAFSRELAGEKRLAKLEEAAERKNTDVRSLLSKARALKRAHGETRLGPRIDRLIARLESM